MYFGCKDTKSFHKYSIIRYKSSKKKLEIQDTVFS